MCQRQDLKVDIKDMPFELYQEIIEKLTGVEQLILTGWGEPFMNPDIIKMIELGKKKGMNVRLTTNGSLFTDDLIDKTLESRLDAITFSIDEITPNSDNFGHLVSNQLANIKKLAKKRDEKKSTLKIYLQSVFTMKNSEEILKIAEFVKDNNLDRHKISRLDIRFHDYQRPSLKEEKKLVKKIEKILKNTKSGVDFLPHSAFDGVTRKIYRFFYPLLHQGGKYCLRTYSDVYIDEKGEVTPCCSLPLLSMGNIKKESLIEIWKNKKFVQFRKNQKTVCGRCDILSLKPNNR
jgi:MoaA/NifB/PqqE/SkfB family radical SAM enzyme